MKERNLSRNHSKRKYITIGVVALLILVGLGVAAYVAASHYAARQLQSIEEQYMLDVSYDSVSPLGYGSLRVNGFTVDSYKTSVFVYAHSFVIKANFWKSSFSHKDVEGFEIDELHITLINEPKQSSGTRTDYGAYVGMVFERLSALPSILPPYVSIRHIHFYRYDGENNEHIYYIPKLVITGNRFVAEMQHTDDDDRSHKWTFKGLYRQNLSKISLDMYVKDKETITLPFVKDYTNATIRFDTLSVDLQVSKDNWGTRILRGKAGVKGLSVYHTSLSADTINFGEGYMTYNLFVGRNFLELDSSATTVNYKELQFSPYLRAEKGEKWKLKAALDKGNFPANDLFASLPEGLFGNLDGMEVAGTLSYHFLLDVDMARVNDLALESSAQTSNFSIVKYGKTDLRKMSTPFVHTIYYKGDVVRKFEVGRGNPDFRSIHAISRYLPAAIMHGEDFAFYRHRGFYLEAFKVSLIENLEAGKFVRGASTLTMQLVKNIFLNLDKTLARKMEEILIVWLIEENRLTSKSRMFEVYMNIIEWGPDVYGIAEAARFYFSKEPSALTLSECIFLAYIIPYPRYIRNHFDGLRLKHPYPEFFRGAVKRLTQRGYISPEEAARANPDIVFKGRVIEYMVW
jgi:hypothetical protein